MTALLQKFGSEIFDLKKNSDLTEIIFGVKIDDDDQDAGDLFWRGCSGKTCQARLDWCVFN